MAAGGGGDKENNVLQSTKRLFSRFLPGVTHFKNEYLVLPLCAVSFVKCIPTLVSNFLYVCICSVSFNSRRYSA